MAQLKLFSEPEEKKKFDMGVGAWFDRLMRTTYASANFTKALTEGKDPFKAVGRGLTGQDKTTYFDVLTSLGWKPTLPSEKRIKAIVGTAGDILFDPITYIPVGGLLAKGGQKLGKISGVAKATTALRETPAVQTLGKALVPGFRPMGISPDIWSKFKGIQTTAKNIERLGTQEALQFSTGILDDINKVRKLGKFSDETLGTLVQSVERRSVAGGLPDTIKPIWKKLTTYADDVAKRRKTIGKTLLDDDDYNYWLHLLSEPEKKSLQKLGLDVGFREYTTKSASDLARQYVKIDGVVQKIPLARQQSLMKAGKKIEQATIEEVNSAIGREFFTTDVPYTSFVMGKRLAKQEAGQAFFDSVKDLGSKVRGPNWVTSSAPELKGLYFNPVLSKEIDATRKMFVNEEVSKGFIKMFDTVQNYWKLQTLGIFPSYHFRNAIGNIWNNFLGGVSNPQVYHDSYKILGKMKQGVKLNPAETKLYKLAVEQGVFGRGIMGAEVPRYAPRLMTKAEGVVQATRKPAETGMKFGEKWVEDPARFAHFIDKINKKWTPQEAAISVKKYLFDYTELTPFESNVLRRLMPFYTWSRKNIPLQIEALVKQPGKPLSFEKLRTEMGKAAGVTLEDKEYLPDWVKKRMPFFFPSKGKEKRYFPVESWLPLGDVMKLERPQNIIGELTTPLIKAPLEMVMNKVFYFDKPIQEYAGQTKELFRKDVPAYLDYALRQIRLINEADRLIGRAKRSKDQPPLPTITERLGRAATGMKFYPYDVKKAKRSRVWELKKDLQALKIGLSRASKYGRENEAQRVMARVEKVMKELEKASE